MTPPPVSVIVVSRGRPDALVRCLTGLEQLDHPNFEIVIVADRAGLAAVGKTRFSKQIKSVEFEEANISKARNLGLGIAAGAIIAFIDDDAVPEPTWLTYLTAPFAADDVAAAGGYVRGRNGISFQNKARRVDAVGDHTDLVLDGDTPQVFATQQGNGIKTEGTNCAFRRDVLAKLGGFDPAFAFYMDETDLNLRLAAVGYKTAIVPLAQVHHGFAASAHRHHNRMPRSLFDVGASQMVLLRKHAAGGDAKPVLNNLRADQKARLLRHMVAGTCQPNDVTRVLSTLEAGLEAGKTRELNKLDAIEPSKEKFLKFKSLVAFNASKTLAGRIWQSNQLRSKAARLVAEGHRVSLFLFSPTALFHQVEFTGDGVWEQTGGLWGRSDRSDQLFTLFRFSARLRHEVDRVSILRNLMI